MLTPLSKARFMPWGILRVLINYYRSKRSRIEINEMKCGLKPAQSSRRLDLSEIRDVIYVEPLDAALTDEDDIEK